MARIETDNSGIITRYDDRGQPSHLHSDFVWINAATGAVGIAAEGVRTMLTPVEAEMAATLDRVVTIGKVVTS